MLQLDYLIHGYVDVSDPGHLEYHYELLYRDVVRRFVENRKIVVSLLHWRRKLHIPALGVARMAGF